MAYSCLSVCNLLTWLIHVCLSVCNLLTWLTHVCVSVCNLLTWLIHVCVSVCNLLTWLTHVCVSVCNLLTCLIHVCVSVCILLTWLIHVCVLVCVFIGYRCFFDVVQLFQYILVCWNIYVYLRAIASLFLVNEIGREDGARNLKMTQNRTWVKAKHFLFACFLSFSPYCSLFYSLYFALGNNQSPNDQN